MRDAEPDRTDFREARLRSYVYHYQRDLSGNWSRRELPGSSFSYDRNKIIAANNDDLYAVINRDGIYRAQANDNWQHWQLLTPLTDHTLYAEVQIDRSRMGYDGALSFVNLASPGKMLVFDYNDEAEQATRATGGGPLGYQYCATENGTCRFTGARDVAYGAAGRFYHRRATDETACNTATFGEPIRGSVKRCYVSNNTVESLNTEGPSAYRQCAGENGACALTAATQQVAYGADGQLHYRLAAESVNCTNGEFGDPINGVEKNCYVFDGAAAGASSSSSSASSSSSSSSNSSSSSSSSSSGYGPTAPEEAKGGGVYGSLSWFVFMLGLGSIKRRNRAAI